jgi:hypothetical protein
VGSLSAGLFVEKTPAQSSATQQGTTEFQPAQVLAFRAILANYDDPRQRKQSRDNFWDKEAWDQRLRQWSGDGFNAIVWWGYNELQNGRHALIRFEELPEAREVPADENEQIIQQMKWLFGRAKSLGMQNFLYPILIAYTNAYSKAHGLDKPMATSPTVSNFHTVGYGGGGAGAQFDVGVRNDATRKFIESAFAEMIKTYDDLDGFYGPMGEAVPGDKSTYFQEAVLPGLNRSGRKPLYIIHQWQVPLNEWVQNILPYYDNKWLGFHAYNAEHITDAKPVPGLVEWAETVGLPTVAALWPANINWLPFNSPRFAWHITQEMKKTANFKGFVYWPSSAEDLLFRKSLARSARGESYSEEPSLALLEEKYGDREAARHFLRAYDISGRIIPELSALIWQPGNDFEARLPYSDLTYNRPSSWTTSRVRGLPLLPIWHYAYWAAKNPKAYKNRNGSEWQTARDFSQQMAWGTEEDYDILPSTHMRKVRSMGEACSREAEQGRISVRKNKEQAQALSYFMQAYQFLSRYWETKVAAAVAAQIYGHSHNAEDKAEAERLADEVVASYSQAATFLHEKVDPIFKASRGTTMKIEIWKWGPQVTHREVELPELIETEKEERTKLAQIFQWQS